ncbi:helix-turn-helix transcriptional regulator [Paenibacillus sp. ACRRX]|uniref:helix-turn-helix transcriptional regulator n=1 Tax=Paenibacillus TaxID=44249 RepID=UPI00041C3C29|nr:MULTISPECIES: helix-turn-helix transcriptional regulator [Paenibacillus]MCG7409660.1 helix-turn-helix transcriptional regulator [Paenibacillus sp. ACRRX]MDK8183262.1 helix-turn-helix transcriptional regulator [Paenibacillus sp. UMB4589-SE434]
MRRIRLIQLRGKQTLDQVATQIGITRQMLGAIERGTRTPSLAVAKRIANHYGMSVDALFYEDENRDNSEQRGCKNDGLDG